MPKSIPTTGALSTGSAAGSDRSINLLKNIKVATAQNEPDSSLNGLRTWFRDNVGTQGMLQGTILQGDNSKLIMSDWRGALIYGVRIECKNQIKNAGYYDTANGEVKMTGLEGDRGTYVLTFNGVQQTVNYNQTASWNFQAGTVEGDSKNYPCYIQHTSNAQYVQTKEDFSLTLYAGNGNVTINGWGPENQQIQIGNSSGTSFVGTDVYIGVQ